MRRYLFAVLLFSGLAFAQVNGKTSDMIPQILVHSRYVYVTSNDGPWYSPGLRSDDRQAIADVENEITRWKHWAVVNDPREAELILVVMRRGNEDVMWIYDARPPGDSLLWWLGQRDGLDRQKMPIMRRLESLIDKAKTS